MLFVGCRNRTGDLLYAEELEELGGGGLVKGVHAAFSREGTKRVYVQDLVREQGEEVWGVIGPGRGRVCVAGSSGGMPKGVKDAVERVVREVGGVGSAKEYVDAMVKEGRYREECW